MKLKFRQQQHAIFSAIDFCSGFTSSFRNALAAPTKWTPPSEARIHLTKVFDARVFIAIKSVLFLSVFFLGKPVNSNQFLNYDARWPSIGPPVLLSRLACTDAADYIYLAKTGYKSGSRFCAFYPLWPFILRYSGAAESSIAPLYSTGISILFWGLGSLILYKWIRDTTDPNLANSIILTLLALPSSIFFWLGYTESLFFFLTVIYVTKSESPRWWPSVIAIGLIPLTRPVGIFVIAAPALALLVKTNNRSRLFFQLGSCLVGYLCYLIILWLATGNPTEGFRAQQFYTNQPNLYHFLNPLELIDRYFSIDGWHTPKGSILDRLTFFWYILLLFPLWKIRPIWFFWALPMVAVPAFTNWFLSFSRFTIVILPLTLSLGFWLHFCDRRFFRLFLLFGLINQLYLLNLYFSFDWAS